MIFTREGRFVWWLVMLSAWGLSALAACLHVAAFRDYTGMLNGLAQQTPPAITPMPQVLPTYTDAQTWVRYALTMEEGAPWRVRFTRDDNAPDGREVHWSSGFTQAVAAAGRLRAASTGEPLPLATEQMLPWFNLPLLLGVVVLFSTWTARRAGAGAGALVALGMVGMESFYGSFAPYYVDHHGVLTAAAFGVVLGAIFMGGSWWRAKGPDASGLLPGSRTASRYAAIFSAACGAVGMWFSAASTIPVIALTGLSGLVVAWTLGWTAQREGAEFDPSLWRLWGRVGAAGSLFFYLLEYAPAHLGLRMEVNHPFFALAWWGGSEIVAQLAQRRLATSAYPAPPLRRLVWPVVAMSAAPFTVLAGGTRVFVVGDPFVADVSKYVAEGQSLLHVWKVQGWEMFSIYVNWNVAPLAIVAVLLFRRTQRDKALLAFSGIVALGFSALLFAKVRWAASASGPLLCLLLVIVVASTQGRGVWARWLAVGVVILGCFAPTAISRVRAVRERVTARMPDRGDVAQVLYRDVAAALRASQPSGDIVLLTSPNGSSSIGYYGGFRTIGTLYWENYAGMRAAAEIFSASSADTARDLVRQRGITHLAMISEESFLLEFFRVLRPEGTPEEFTHTFGYQLLYEQKLPVWLRPISYQVPAGASLPELRVMLLQVVPDQTESETLWHLAVAQLARGEIPNATQNFEAAVATAPAARRVQLCTEAANLCFTSGAHASAVRLYRAVLTAGENLEISANLAWVLATTHDDRLRNGTQALAIAQKLPANNPATLGVLAAALAETGQFPEAINAASRALDLLKATGNTTATAAFAAQLEAYRAGKPWRR